MGMVSESRNYPPYVTTTRWSGNGNTASRNFGPYVLRSESQYGYRSGPLGLAEQRRIEALDATGKWGRQKEMLDALDRIQTATTPTPYIRSRTRAVHSRDYTEFHSIPADYIGGGWVNPNVPFEYSGTAAITGISTVPPPNPSLSALEGIAGSTMRGYVPVRPDANLARFIGELKDAPQMARLNSYLPNGFRDFGSAHLNLQFGLLPTASDIQKNAEAVLRADKMTRQFVRDSSRLIHRTAVKQIDSTSPVITSGTATGSVATRASGGIGFRHDFGAPGSSYWGPTFDTYLSFNSSMRVFSTFEYFVGDPDGFTTRMDSYVQKAQKIVGLKLDESTIYALTPWSWLLDWFYDIGSLLRYQQSVADYHLVQRWGGWVLETVQSASVTFNGSRFGGLDAYYGTRGSITATKKVQTRRRGSPYSMTPTWSLNGFQWGIVAALGLTKAPGIPLFD